MFLAPDNLSSATPLTRHDSVFALVLTMALVLATATFFGPFAIAAMLMGLVLAVVLHRWAGDPSHGFAATDPLTPINIASVHIGGDAGGLIFVLGSVAILGLGIPTLRWFLVASVIVAGAVATGRIAWMSGHSRDRMTSLFRHIASLA